MRSEQEIEEALKSLGIPCDYNALETRNSIDAPFLVWYFPETNNFEADGEVYVRISVLAIELYTDSKNKDLEKLVEDLLESREMVWEKEEQFLMNEKLYRVKYETEVILNE